MQTPVTSIKEVKVTLGLFLWASDLVHWLGYATIAVDFYIIVAYNVPGS